VTHVDADGVETVLVEGAGAANYSVSLTSPLALPSVGSVTYPADQVTPLPTGESIIIQRILPLLQPTDLENQGGYLPDVQEATADRGIMIDQQLQEQIDRALLIALSLDVDNALPTPVADYILAWNSTGTALISVVGPPLSGLPSPIADYFIAWDPTGTFLVSVAGSGGSLGALLDSIAALAPMAADRYIYTTAENTVAAGTLTSFTRTLLDDTTAGAWLTTLGITAFAQTLLDDTTAAAFRATLAVPYDHELDLGTPNNSVTAYRGVIGRAHTWDDAAAHVSSAGTATAAATGDQVFLVKKNGSTVLTVTYSAEDTDGVIAFSAGDVTWAAGDVLTIIAPAGIESTTLADVGMTFLSAA
jgi:hypothetical protein